MKAVLVLLFLAHSYAQCCGPTWIRDSQTSKSLAISAFTSDGRTTTYGLINATGPTTVRDLQFSLILALQRTSNGDTSDTTQQLPNCNGPYRSCCDTCTRYYSVSLYINLDSVVEFALPITSNQLFQSTFEIVPLTSPANYYGILTSQTGLLQCFCDKDVVSYSSLTDSLFETYFPDGIQLNAGQSIDLVINTGISPDCTNTLANGLQSRGVVNFIYAYAEKEKAEKAHGKH